LIWLTFQTGTSTNCYTGNLWDASICPTPAACTAACAIDGVDNADWTGTYGVTASGNELSIKFVTQGPFSKNIGSRNYLTEPGGTRYIENRKPVGLWPTKSDSMHHMH
jgi:cellulose 1,4-beta-cellobiosidase